MKPNKKQRHEIYEQALVEVMKMPQAQGFGLCFFVKNATRIINPEYSDIYTALKDYPEIYECRTATYISKDCFFFEKDEEGLFQRLAILDNAIRVTK